MYCRCLISALLIAGPLYTQAAAAADEQQGLQPIVVTATRTAQPRAATLAATTVITRAEIERMQPRSVAELLRWTPGISVSNSGGAGKASSIHMRGTNSDHTLVLINGVRYASATLGTPAIADIPVANIKRIEIVRGPQSSLYGADAIGGVIQIFTRNGTEAAGLQPYADVTAGSYGTYGANVGLSGNDDDSHFNVTLSRTHTDGFDATAGPRHGDDDGYERTSGSLRAGFALGENAEVSVHALRVASENEFDGSFVDYSEAVRQVFGASVAAQLAAAWHMTLSLGHQYNDIDNYKNGRFKTSFETTSNSLRWQNDITLSTGSQLILGADYRHTQVDGTTDYSVDARDTTGVFAQYLGTFGAHQLQLALRADAYDTFDDSLTGSVHYGWHFDAIHTLTLSYGTAYNVPTFNDLYWPHSGNPTLEPEQSESYEIGLKTQRAWGHWAVYAYQTNIDDLIAWYDPDLTTPSNPWRVGNVNAARIRGVEASIEAHFGPWGAHASAAYVDTENRSHGAHRGKQLIGRPQYNASVRVTRYFGAYSLGASLRYGGSRYADAANTVKLDDFVLVGLQGSWQVTDAWQLQASVDNLFDADYQTDKGYNQLGRAFYLSVSYRP